MGVPKRLTEMQKRFAEYMVFGGPRRYDDSNGGSEACWL